MYDAKFVQGVPVGLKRLPGTKCGTNAVIHRPVAKRVSESVRRGYHLDAEVRDLLTWTFMASQHTPVSVDQPANECVFEFDGDQWPRHCQTLSLCEANRSKPTYDIAIGEMEAEVAAAVLRAAYAATNKDGDEFDQLIIDRAHGDRVSEQTSVAPDDPNEPSKIFSPGRKELSVYDVGTIFSRQACSCLAAKQRAPTHRLTIRNGRTSHGVSLACHLRYDAKHHAQTARQTRAARSGQQALAFKGGGG